MPCNRRLFHKSEKTMKNETQQSHRWMFALLISFAAWAPLSGASSGTGRGCVSVAVSSAQVGGGAVAQTFSLSQIIDLDISVGFVPGVEQRFKGAHEAEFRMFTPHGFLYQSVSIPFTSEPGKRGQQTRVTGYPEPMDYRILEPAGNRPGNQLAVHIRVPVAGTPIANNSLLGAWRAEVFIDGDTLPCSQGAVFTITR
jgi:hypothetical protein